MSSVVVYANGYSDAYSTDGVGTPGYIDPSNAPFNVFILAFLYTTKQFSAGTYPGGASDFTFCFGFEWAEAVSTDPLYLSPGLISWLKLFKSASPSNKVMISVGGSAYQNMSPYPVWSTNPNQVVYGLTLFVNQFQNAYGFAIDGIDFDYEDDESLTSSGSFSGSDLLIALTNGMKTAMGTSFLVTHAPQSPYLWPGTIHYTTGNFPGYLPIIASAMNNIDWLNIQFYNQGVADWEGCTGAPGMIGVLKFLEAGNPAGSTNVPTGTPVFAGVPSSKLAVGKPLEQSDANQLPTGGGDGYFTPAQLASCLGSNGVAYKLMFWQISGDNPAQRLKDLNQFSTQVAAALASGPSARPASGPTPTSGPTSGPSSGPSSRPGQGPASGPSSRPGQGPASGPSSRPGQGPASGPSSRPGRGPASGPSTNPAGQRSNGLSAGAIAGILIAIAVVAVILALVFTFGKRGRKRPRTRAPTIPINAPNLPGGRSRASSTKTL
jgi:hypothetical protein